MAKGLHNVSTETYMGLESMRAGMEHFVAPGYWRKFKAIGDEWEFFTFADFCKEWMRFPLDALRRVFHDDDEIRAIIAEQVGNEKVYLAEAVKDKVAEGKTQRQVADEVGVCQATTSNILSKGSILPKTNQTQSQKAEAAGRHTQSQKDIEAVRKVNPELADRADKGDIKINDALKQIGRGRITILNNPESAARTIAKHFSNEDITDLINRLSMTLEALESA